LQLGKPVVDIAVFTGEETPRRAILPDRLVGLLPGIFGQERVAEEELRLQNAGTPVREMPRGVKTQANMADPGKWIDPMRGYSYDSFNKDALLNLTKVDDGRIVLPGGASYGLLVIPGKMKMSPDGGECMSLEVAKKLLDLANEGATLILSHKPVQTLGWQNSGEADRRLKLVIDELFSGKSTTIADPSGGQFTCWRRGKGRIVLGPYQAETFDKLGIPRDFSARGERGSQAGSVAWNHRREGRQEIYFVANQLDQSRTLELTFRVQGKVPELYDPVTNETRRCSQWQSTDGLTKFSYRFEPNESLFVLFNEGGLSSGSGKNWTETVNEMTISGDWTVQFDPAFGGPDQPVLFNGLTDWSTNSDERIRYYSGTAIYSKSFQWEKNGTDKEALWLELGSFANIAEVKLNDLACGASWTAPFRIRIDRALKQGENTLEIAVTNTWANRLMGDHKLPEGKRITWTTAPYRLEGKPMLPAGLLGPVAISREMKSKE
jgi:hypothetical protein